MLPPAVAGIGLLAAFGRLGLLGGTLETLGVRIGFTQAAVVLAILFVAGPFYLRPAIAAFEAVDPTLLAAARTLGAGPGRTFARVALPLAGSGLSAAAALSLARGIGEFGATIMFAGSLQGVTQTLSLAIYRQFDVDFTQALAMGALLVVRQRGRPARDQGGADMAALVLDVACPLRSFELELALEVGRETFALVGPSGAGKTTVLRAIAGLVRPARGAGSCSATRRCSTPSAASTGRRRSGASGCVFQEYALFPHLTVEANVGFGGRERARRAARALRDRAPGEGAARASSRAASASGSRSPGRLRATRRCCCSTSRWPRSTRTRARVCAPSSRSCCASSACRRSSSPTTSRTPPRSPTGSA